LYSTSSFDAEEDWLKSEPGCATVATTHRRGLMIAAVDVSVQVSVQGNLALWSRLMACGACAGYLLDA
jgi:hypothetical protein